MLSKDGQEDLKKGSIGTVMACQRIGQLDVKVTHDTEDNNVNLAQDGYKPTMLAYTPSTVDVGWPMKIMVVFFFLNLFQILFLIVL